MAIQFANYASTTITASISSAQTVIPVLSLTGLPVANGGANYWYATLADFATQGSNLREVVKVTNQSGSSGAGTITVVRGQDNTAPAAFPAGSLCDSRANAQALLDLIASSGAPANASYVTTQAEGSLSAERVLTGSATLLVTDNGANTTVVLSVPANAVTNAVLAQMAQHTFKGNNTGGTANALDLTATQLTAELNPFVASGAGHLKGLVPDPGVTGGTTKFLREDATFQVPPGTGAPATPTYVTINNESATLANSRRLAVSAEITVVDGGAGSTYTFSITPNGITNGMLAQMATLTVKANVTGGTANAADVTLTTLGPLLPVFGASGGSHTVGQVPDPGGSAGSTRFLREDSTWGIPVGSAGTPLAPNLFRNSGMVVNQRATQTLTTAALIGSVDSWAVWASAGAVTSGTITQSAAAPVGQTGYAAALSPFTVTGAAVISFRQRIESRDAVRLKNQTASCQFNVYQDTGGAINYTIFVRKATVQDNFTATTNISNSGAISVNTATATTVTYNNIAMGDVSNGIEIEVQAATGAVTAKNLYWTEAEIHQGTSAQQYQFVPFQTEIDWVQRFYQKSFPYATAPAQNAGLTGVAESHSFVAALGTLATFGVKFGARMRGTPAVTLYNPSAANAQVRDITNAVDHTSTATNQIGDQYFYVSSNTGSNNRAATGVHWAADAEF